MMMKVAAISAALLLGTMSHAALAQAPTAPAAGTTAPVTKTVPPKAATTPAPAAKTIVGAKPAAAVNACRGLAEPDCGAKAEECSYVKAYKTKAGKQVAGYCKSKPKPRAAKAAAKPATAPAAAVKAPAATAPATKPAGTTPPAAPPKN